jgi:hypothetical protein
VNRRLLINSYKQIAFYFKLLPSRIIITNTINQTKNSFTDIKEIKMIKKNTLLLIILILILDFVTLFA